MSSQKTRHQKLNSYWVTNSLGDKICPPAAVSAPVNISYVCLILNVITGYIFTSVLVRVTQRALEQRRKAS